MSDFTESITEDYRGYTLTDSYYRESRPRGVLIEKDGKQVTVMHILNFKVAKRLVDNFLEANGEYPYPLPIKFKKQPVVGNAVK